MDFQELKNKMQMSLRGISDFFGIDYKTIQKWNTGYRTAPDYVIELMNYKWDCENKKIYGKLENKNVYARAVLDFISGMTDRYAIMQFEEFFVPQNMVFYLTFATIFCFHSMLIIVNYYLTILGMPSLYFQESN